MAQQEFPQLPYKYGDGLRGAAIAQTRDGKDELITPVALWERNRNNGLYLPPGMLSDADVAKPRVEATLTGSNLALRNTIVTGAKTVTSTAAEVFAGASRLSGRHAMVITNTGNNTVYIGTSTVSASNGFPVFPQDTIRIEFDPQSSVAVFAVSDGPNVEVRVVELA